MTEKANKTETTPYVDKFAMDIQMHIVTFLLLAPICLVHYYSKTKNPSVHISLTVGILVNRFSTALFYSKPEWSIEILEGNFNNMLIGLPKIHKYLEDFVDKTKGLEYIADLFHVAS